MAKYLLIYRRASDLGDKITAEEMQRQMEKWRTWIAEGFQKGWMVDPGDALTQEGRVVKPKQVVVDGPFAEAKEIVGGYSIIQADSIEAAVQYAKGCPALQSGGSVEVRVLAGFTEKR